MNVVHSLGNELSPEQLDDVDGGLVSMPFPFLPFPLPFPYPCPFPFPGGSVPY